MVTHVGAQVSELILGLRSHKESQGKPLRLYTFKTDVTGCKELAKQDPDEAVMNVHSLAFFIVNSIQGDEEETGQEEHTPGHKEHNPGQEEHTPGQKEHNPGQEEHKT